MPVVDILSGGLAFHDAFLGSRYTTEEQIIVWQLLMRKGAFPRSFALHVTRNCGL